MNLVGEQEVKFEGNRILVAGDTCIFDGTGNIPQQSRD